MKKPLVLMILDGYGSNPGANGNAIEAANKHNTKRFILFVFSLNKPYFFLELRFS